MPGVEFVRRFVQHILPTNFRRVRYSGLLGQRHRSGNLERCRELLEDRIAPAVEEEPETLEEAGSDEDRWLSAPVDSARQPTQSLLPPVPP